MVSSLFLPAACRCVLSPLYPVPTHLKRGICIVFSLLIYTFIRLFLRFSPVLPILRRAALSRGEAHLTRRFSFQPPRGLWPLAHPAGSDCPPAADTVREVAGKGRKTSPTARCKKALYAGGGRPGNSAVTQTKKPPLLGRPFWFWITFSGAAPDGRPRSGRE